MSTADLDQRDRLQGCNPKEKYIDTVCPVCNFVFPVPHNRMVIACPNMQNHAKSLIDSTTPVTSWTMRGEYAEGPRVTSQGDIVGHVSDGSACRVEVSGDGNGIDIVGAGGSGSSGWVEPMPGGGGGSIHMGGGSDAWTSPQVKTGPSGVGGAGYFQWPKTDAEVVKECVESAYAQAWRRSQHALGKAERELKAANEACERWQGQLKEARKHAEELLTRCNGWKHNADHYFNLSNQSNEAHLAANRDVVNLRKKVEHLEKVLAVKNTEAHELQTKYDGVEAARWSMLSINTRLNTSVSSLEKQIARLSCELGKVRQERDNFMHTCEGLRADNAQICEARQVEWDAIQRRTAEFDDVVKDRKLIQEEVVKLRVDMELTQKQNATLKEYIVAHAIQTK